MNGAYGTPSICAQIVQQPAPGRLDARYSTADLDRHSMSVIGKSRPTRAPQDVASLRIDHTL